MEIRNIAIIAHVDHGKTTLTDAIMRQTGMFEEGMSMDTNVLERERGITIYSKNTSCFYPPSREATDGQAKTTKINIVDTPGHADFGSEVERVLRSIDSVLLIVDAQEGPMPQTRFVLKKSLELGLKPIVVINKIDKPAADPKKAVDEVLELFMDLGANDEQLDFTVVYAIGREGIAKMKLEDESKDVSPLLDTILREVPAAKGDINAPFRAQPFNLGYDNYLGRLAICRVYDGVARPGMNIYIKKPVNFIEGDKTVDGAKPASAIGSGEARPVRIVKIFSFKGISRVEAAEGSAGDIVVIAGLPNIEIGDTICADASQETLPAIKIDEPTIALNFLVNNSPFAGREGKYVTSRQIRERLEKELEVNVGLKIDFEKNDAELAGEKKLESYHVYGRGELHVAILLENMRREGYEVQVSQPQAIVKEIDGVMSEPFEEIIIDAPQEFQGAIIEKMGQRACILNDIKQHHGTVRMIFEGPTRGLLGYRGQFMVDTKGNGILSSRFIGFRPHVGDIRKRAAGSMVSMAQGKALAFALDNLQTRGELYIGANTEVYEGMVLGNTSKGDEMYVNPTKGKHLTNVRSAGNDENICLVPAKILTIESGLEVMEENEYLEITPKSVRLRKIEYNRI